MAKKKMTREEALRRDGQDPGVELSGLSGETRPGPDAQGMAEAVPLRISQTGKKIRAEATRTLGRERPPVTRAVSRRLDCFSFPGLNDSLTQEERMRVVEVPDAFDRPLLCMSPENAMRQKLSFRLVVAALRTRQNRIVLRKRNDSRLGMPGSWDLYTGFVFVGEALEDAAIRLLGTDAGVGWLGITLLEASEDKNGVRRALFVAELPAGLHPAHDSGEILELDADELEGLVRDTPELLTPEVIWAQQVQGLFRKR